MFFYKKITAYLKSYIFSKKNFLATQPRWIYTSLQVKWNRATSYSTKALISFINLKTNTCINLITNTMPVNNFVLPLYRALKYVYIVVKEGVNHFIEGLYSHGWLSLRTLGLTFFIDACLTDDEPLWEPVEWSLVQTWIMFIFFFAWIVENLISSRYGSYTGRDKRIWFSWYKTFWLIDLIYIVSYGAACLFVIVPFYHEITYSLPFVVSWWNWYSRVFFFKFVSLYAIALVAALYLQANVRTMNWEHSLVLIVLISCLLSYLLYMHFLISFFGYFTDPAWYRNNRLVDYIQLSHEPLRWGFGPSKRDHFSYHKTTTVFWFKSDGPFASAFLLIHFFFFFSLFSTYMYWITLVRRVVTTQEVPYTYTTYCTSALYQFMYFFFFLFGLSLVSFLTAYWRFPIEFLWVLDNNPWYVHFWEVLCDYPEFIISIFI